MTKFVERKRPVLTTDVFSCIDILPVFPTLLIAHVQSTHVLSQTHLKTSLTFSKPILTSFMPENYKHEDQSNSKPLSHSDINKCMENKLKHRSQELNKLNSATVLPT